MSADRRVQDDIDALISSENDPGKRAVLIVLNSINRSLIANTIATEMTQENVVKLGADFSIHLKNFEGHAMNEEMLMARGKGAWWVLSVVLAAMQAIAVYGWIASRNEIDGMKSQAHASEILHQQLQSRIDVLEKRP